MRAYVRERDSEGEDGSHFGNRVSELQMRCTYRGLGLKLKRGGGLGVGLVGAEDGKTPRGANNVWNTAYAHPRHAKIRADEREGGRERIIVH